MNERQTIEELQKEFKHIYGKANRALTVPDILIRIDEQTGYLGRLLLEDEPAEPVFIKIFSWLCALCNALEVSLQSALLQKYPRYCPYCLEKGCRCAQTNKLPLVYEGSREEDLQWKYKALIGSQEFSKATANIAYILDLLKSIYPANAIRWKENRYVFLVKLAEERAEIIEAFRRHVMAGIRETKDPLQSEIADFAAWLLSAWQLSYSTTPNYNIQVQLASKYRFGCPYCSRLECECPVTLRFGVRSDPTLPPSLKYEPDAEKRLKEVLTELANSLKSAPELLAEHEALVAIAKANPRPDEVMKYLTLLQARVSSMPGEPALHAVRLVRGISEWLGQYFA